MFPNQQNDQLFSSQRFERITFANTYCEIPNREHLYSNTNRTVSTMHLETVTHGYVNVPFVSLKQILLATQQT